MQTLPPVSTLPACEPADAGLCPQRSARLLEVLRSEIGRERLPGAVVLVARHGKVGIFEALGQQDPHRGVVMARDSIFRLYSMTKPLVSVATMVLMEQGRLLLSDPVAKYLPEFGAMQVVVEEADCVRTEPARRPITVQDLMRHTAGFTYEFSGTSAVQRSYRTHALDRRLPGRDLAAYCRALAALPLMDQPGSVGEYSRATDVLGRLVEVVAGMPLGMALREYIFAPLGMPDTGFVVPREAHHRIAEPFRHDPDGGAQMPMLDILTPPEMESGGGGLAGTAMDYARFLQCLLQRGSLGGTRVLAPHTVDFMTADHLGRIPARDSLLDPGEGFGLGFAVRLARGVTPVPGPVGTYYWSGMAGTSFFVDPSNGLFAIMMIQAPNQRAWYRQLFRNLVYACVVDEPA
jgi:CubicO group peptidase (beta-lactamase class C family)